MTKRRPPSASPSKAPRRGLSIAIAVCLAVLVLVNMVIIFQFSSADKQESGDLSAGVTQWLLERLYPDFSELTRAEQQSVLQKAHKFIRKAAHFSEFGLLGFLSAGLLLFVSSHFKRLRLWLTLAAPALFTLLYAISDEIHQIFSNRGPRVTDVLIDFSGAVCGILLIHGLVWLITHGKRERPTRKGKRSPKRRKRHA